MNNELVTKSKHILEELRQDKTLSRYIDPQYGIPGAYIGKGPIRLIVLGQDPTVKKEASRGSIRTPQEKELLQREIESTDRAIDALVYELYGLTEEEIKIVEGKA